VPLEDVAHNAVKARLADLVQSARKRNIWPATFGLASSGIEMMAAGGAHSHLGRFRMEVFRASPRPADLMIVAGRISHEAPVLRRGCDQ
jgi:NADH-quinone oxidoreductase subunit B